MQPDVDVIGGADGRYVLSFMANLDAVVAAMITGMKTRIAINDLQYHDGSVNDFVASATAITPGEEQRTCKPCLQCEALFVSRWIALRGRSLEKWPTAAQDELEHAMDARRLVPGRALCAQHAAETVQGVIALLQDLGASMAGHIGFGMTIPSTYVEFFKAANIPIGGRWILGTYAIAHFLDAVGGPGLVSCVSADDPWEYFSGHGYRSMKYLDVNGKDFEQGMFEWANAAFTKYMLIGHNCLNGAYDVLSIAGFANLPNPDDEDNPAPVVWFNEVHGRTFPQNSKSSAAEIVVDSVHVPLQLPIAPERRRVDAPPMKSAQQFADALQRGTRDRRGGGNLRIGAAWLRRKVGLGAHEPWPYQDRLTGSDAAPLPSRTYVIEADATAYHFSLSCAAFRSSTQEHWFWQDSLGLRPRARLDFIDPETGDVLYRSLALCERCAETWIGQRQQLYISDGSRPQLLVYEDRVVISQDGADGYTFCIPIGDADISMNNTIFAKAIFAALPDASFKINISDVTELRFVGLLLKCLQAGRD